MLRLLTFSTLFPNREQPEHGVFVENRLREALSFQGVPLIIDFKER